MVCPALLKLFLYKIQDIVTKGYVDSANNITLTQLREEGKQYVKHDGSSPMTEVLNMGGCSVSNVAEPVCARDIVTKGYADNLVGSTYLNTRGNEVVNLIEPAAGSDDATKGYVD